MSTTTWRAEIASEMEKHGETWEDAVSSVLGPRWRYSDDTAPEVLSFDTEFDCGYGGSEGARFTVWTANRVYFPVVYDGAEWCGSVPRNPSTEATEHVGGQ